MKPDEPTGGALEPAAPAPKLRAEPIPQHWNASAFDLQSGVEVTEVLDTLPGELWDLFVASGDAGGR